MLTTYDELVQASYDHYTVNICAGKHAQSVCSGYQTLIAYWSGRTDVGGLRHPYHVRG